MSKQRVLSWGLATSAAFLGGCTVSQLRVPVIPSESLSDQIRARYGSSGTVVPAQHRSALEQNGAPNVIPTATLVAGAGNLPTTDQSLIKDFNGPLSLGDPGLAASLYRESRGGSEMFRDIRAFQPMDLLTVVVTERSEGRKEANTEVRQQSNVLGAITGFFGLQNRFRMANNEQEGTGEGAVSFAPDPEALIEAKTTNDFRGQGNTRRLDTLTGRISAMVMEVLPSGILRIEGQRIVTVNGEEQVMVVSGLVRPMDVNSANEVQSSRIAQFRIDYFGRGTLGEAQLGGWISRIMRIVWPF